MRRVLAVSLLLATSLAFAQQPFERTFPVAVSITADGAVSDVQVQDGLPEPVVALAREAAGKLAFEPAAVGGVPKPSKTSVKVRMRFAPAEDGALAAKVLSVTHGNPALAPPLYPINAMRSGISALVWLHVEVTATGEVDVARTRVESLDARYDSGRKVSRNKDAQPLGEAALASALQWPAAPEEVDGVGIATTLRIPVTFCMPLESKPCREFAQGRAPATREPVDDSVRLARLKASDDTAAATDDATATGTVTRTP